MSRSAPRRETAALDARPRRLGIVYNTHSGRRRRTPRALPPGVPAVEANTDAEIGVAVSRLAAQEVDLLAVAGGDGTVQSVLGHVMLGADFERPPLLALVPTGSTNMTARDVGSVDVRRRGWQALRAWADRPRTIERCVARRPVLRIAPNPCDRPFCGMFFGAGAVHHAVRYTQARLHGLGLRGETGPGLAFLRFLKAIASGNRRDFAPIQLRLRDDAGNAVDTSTLLLLASTLDRLVLRFHPFWGQETAPLAWTAVIETARGFLRRVPAIARGRVARGLTPADGYHSHNAWRLELEFDGGYIVDGEFFTARRADGPVVLSIAGDACFLRL